MSAEKETMDIKNYLEEILMNAESKLNEGDYLKIANNLKKVFEMNDEDEDEDGYYKIEYANIYWKPPSSWNKGQIKYVLNGGEYGQLTLQERSLVDDDTLRYSVKQASRDIRNMEFKYVDKEKQEEYYQSDAIDVTRYAQQFCGDEIISTTILGNDFEVNYPFDLCVCRFTIVIDTIFIDGMLKSGVF